MNKDLLLKKNFLKRRDRRRIVNEGLGKFRLNISIWTDILMSFIHLDLPLIKPCNAKYL